MPSSDFDFLFGRWRVQHRRLESRFTECTTWIEFAGTCTAGPFMGGLANVDDNVLELPAGSYRALTLRAYDAVRGQWSIWWLDGRSPGRLDPPVVGGFVDGTGTFYADDTLDGRPIRVRFRWAVGDRAAPHWEQAFSADGGDTWETNWHMAFTPA
jgi:hypothetical protein